MSGWRNCYRLQVESAPKYFCVWMASRYLFSLYFYYLYFLCYIRTIINCMNTNPLSSYIHTLDHQNISKISILSLQHQNYSKNINNHIWIDSLLAWMCRSYFEWGTFFLGNLFGFVGSLYSLLGVSSIYLPCLGLYELLILQCCEDLIAS